MSKCGNYFEMLVNAEKCGIGETVCTPVFCSPDANVQTLEYHVGRIHRGLCSKFDVQR